MGLNVDLTQMLRAPSTLPCPRCHTDVKTGFDDYDIQCGNPNLAPGEWVLDCYCDKCDLSWEHCFAVTLLHPSEKFDEHF